MYNFISSLLDYWANELKSLQKSCGAIFGDLKGALNLVLRVGVFKTWKWLGKIGIHPRSIRLVVGYQTSQLPFDFASIRNHFLLFFFDVLILQLTEEINCLRAINSTAFHKWLLQVNKADFVDKEMESFCVVIGPVWGHSANDFMLPQISRSNQLVTRIGQLTCTQRLPFTVKQFSPGSLEGFGKVYVVFFAGNHAHGSDVFQTVSHADAAVRICHMHLHLFKFIDLTLSVRFCVH